MMICGRGELKMANLIRTIHMVAGTSLSLEMLQGNTMCFITTNGVIIGNPIKVDEDYELTDTKEMLKLQYHLSIQKSKKIETPEDIQETILLEKVKYKVGNTIINLDYLIVNKAQIIAFYSASEEDLKIFIEELVV